jgi:protein-arginine kinase activator protein McsA
MICPKCGSDNSSVMSTRLNKTRDRVYRRRVCEDCGHRWSTYEVEKGSKETEDSIYEEHIIKYKVTSGPEYIYIDNLGKIVRCGVCTLNDNSICSITGERVSDKDYCSKGI